MKSIFAIFTVLFSLTLSAQTFEWETKGAEVSAPKSTTLADYNLAYKERQIGLADGYPSSFVGQATAYGEKYAAEELTAGHAVLPLGTLIEVTNLQNDQSITVRINDKARACQDCLVTLSSAAAEKLGMVVPTKVAVQRIGFSNWNPGESATPKTYNSGPVVLAPTAVNSSSAPEPAPTVPVLNREVTASPSASMQSKGSASTAQTVPSVSTHSTQAAQTPQAAPPAPTVPRYQENRTAPVPVNYPMPDARQALKSSVVTAPAATVAPAKVDQAGPVVQLAAYTNEANATKRVETLSQAGIGNVFYRTFDKSDGSKIHRVYAGGYTDKAAAQKAAEYIRDVHQIAGMVIIID